MEFRQLRYFVTLAEELHFGRAAAREHIVQSALSQQLARLERELGVLLLERTTHHVRLTRAGSAFLVEARQILAHASRAAITAQRAAVSAPTLRVGIVDAGYDSMPQILQQVQQRHPDLEIHQVEVGVPEQFKLLADGRLDVGFGRASLAPAEVDFELVRLDPLGVLVAREHRFAALPRVPVPALATVPVLLGEEERAPEFNHFVVELCRSVGFLPTVHRGTVESIRAAVDLVAQGRCVLCAPESCVSTTHDIVWRPLTTPTSLYPWSVLWRAGERSEYVRAVIVGARALSQDLGWLQPSDRTT
ncbi:LysR family transcriptional regulator [Amycolatopsis vastitatis]|nr:LysR substrate-binding domain-containing protein [Amycolatopsis vastitatis]